MGRKSKAQTEQGLNDTLTFESIGAEEGTVTFEEVAMDDTTVAIPQTEIVSEFENDPRIDSRQAPRKQPSNNPSLRGMALSPEQKELLLNSEMTRILDKKKEDEFMNGVIPCSIDYPYDKDGFTVMHAIIERDARLVAKAWEYYKGNCEEPTVKDFVTRLHKICGRGKVYQRIIPLHLN